MTGDLPHQRAQAQRLGVDAARGAVREAAAQALQDIVVAEHVGQEVPEQVAQVAEEVHLLDGERRQLGEVPEDLDVPHAEGALAPLVEHLQHADRPVAQDHGHAEDVARDVVDLLGERGGEARVGLDVGDREGLARGGDVAGEPLPEREGEVLHLVGAAAQRDLEAQLVARLVHQEQRRRLGVEHRGRHLDDRPQLFTLAGGRRHHPGGGGQLEQPAELLGQRAVALAGAQPLDLSSLLLDRARSVGELRRGIVTGVHRSFLRFLERRNARSVRSYREAAWSPHH